MTFSKISFSGLRTKTIAWVLVGIAVSATAFFATALVPSAGQAQEESKTVRFATFNISFNRSEEGELKSELEKAETVKPKQIAEIIQRVRPDVILLNEFDYDKEGEGVKHFAEKLLAVPQNGQTPIGYEHIYLQPVNTGVDTGLDLNHDGKKSTGNDAFGFGSFPGQYGMVVLSKYEIDRENARTFQTFLWKDMPNSLWPIVPATQKPYYSKEAKSLFRLSSKSHWDVPIKVGDKTIHFLVSHPTPPVFDEEEDRNGKRNHDEIRLFTDYVDPAKSAYIYDDKGVKGGLPKDAYFVIAGDMNADQSDGDSTNSAAKLLTTHPLINHDHRPQSEGGGFYAKAQGKANLEQKGNPVFDTGDFNDFSVGNLNIDYCLPSKNQKIIKSGVFWPKPDQSGAKAITASDHRIVWIDLKK